MQREDYPDHLKIREALQFYFSKYHFVNGGYDLKWFKIKLGPVFIPLPNTKARVDAVKFHDIHHLLTGYPATLRGEAEIGGWEIASGCGKYYAAWVLNFGSLFYGLLFFPGAVYNAFMRGRKCKTNLYHDVRYDDHLLNQTVGELRTMLFDDSRKNNAFDYFLFILCCILILVADFFLLFLLSCLTDG
jgi:hypothetical protein